MTRTQSSIQLFRVLLLGLAVLVLASCGSAAEPAASSVGSSEVNLTTTVLPTAIIDPATPDPTAVPAPAATATASPTASPVPATALPDPTATPLPEGVFVSGEPYALTYGRPLGFSPDASAVLVQGMSPRGGAGCEGAPSQAIWRIPRDQTAPTLEVDDVSTGGVVFFSIFDGWVAWVDACDGWVGDGFNLARVSDDGRFTDRRGIRVGSPTEDVNAEIVSIQDLKVQPDGQLDVFTAAEVISFRDGVEVSRSPLADDSSPSDSDGWDFTAPIHDQFGAEVSWVDWRFVELTPAPLSTGRASQDLIARSTSPAPDPEWNALAALPTYDGWIVRDGEDYCSSLAIQWFDGRREPLTGTSAGYAEASVTSSGEVALKGCTPNGVAIYRGSLDGLVAGETPKRFGPVLRWAPFPLQTSFGRDASGMYFADDPYKFLLGEDGSMVFDSSADQNPDDLYPRTVTLVNERFGFRVDLPTGWESGPQPTNNDGFTFAPRDANAADFDVRIFGTHDADGFYTFRDGSSIDGAVIESETTEIIDSQFGDKAFERRTIHYSLDGMLTTEQIDVVDGRVIVAVVSHRVGMRPEVVARLTDILESVQLVADW